MATNFPTSLDALTNPTSGNTLASPDHAGQHANANDAIEALQAKVGVNSSAVATSIDNILTTKAPLASPTFTGAIGIGSAAGGDTNFGVYSNITGATTAYGVRSLQTIQSGVTTNAHVLSSQPSTVAAAFTVARVNNFSAFGGTIGAGSVVTTQVGFNVSSSMTVAANNYGFYGDIASGTGRWNFYANGTAANYMAGRIGVGATLTTGAMAQITNTTAADKVLILKGAASQTGSLFEIQNSAGTALVAVSDIGNLNVGAGVGTTDSTVQIGTGRTGNGYAYVDLVGDATYTDYGLRIIRNSNGANANSELAHRGTGNFALVAEQAAPLTFSTTNTERMRITSGGDVGIGTGSPTVKLQVTGTTHLTGAGTFPATGTGIELTPAVASGTNYIQAFSRDAGTWQTLAINSGLTTFGTAGVERMRIDSTGQVGIGSTPVANVRLTLTGGSTNSANPIVRLDGVTGSGSLYLHNDLTAGSFNSIVSAGSKGFIAAGANSTTSRASFVIAPWSDTTYGIRFEGGSTTNILQHGTVISSPSLAANKGLIVKGVASQTGNLQDWQDSAGTVLAHVTSAGAAKFVSINGGTA